MGSLAALHPLSTASECLSIIPLARHSPAGGVFIVLLITTVRIDHAERQGGRERVGAVSAAERLPMRRRQGARECHLRERFDRVGMPRYRTFISSISHSSSLDVSHFFHESVRTHR